MNQNSLSISSYNCEMAYQCNDIALAVLNKEQEGVPLIALHGWLDNSNSFLPMSKYLEDFPLIAIDLPGHGHSTHKPDWLPYNITDWCFAIHEFMLAKQLSSANLLGHSLGAAIAVFHSIFFPSEVESIVALDGLFPKPRPATELASRMQRFAQSYAKSVKRKQTPNPSEKSFAELVEKRAVISGISKDNAQLLLSRSSEQQSSDSGEQTMLTGDPLLMLPTVAGYTYEMVVELSGLITVPISLAVPESGIMEQMADLNTLEDNIKTLKIFRLGKGHHFHMEYPEQVGEIIRGSIAP